MIDFNLHFFKKGILNSIPIALIIGPILASFFTFELFWIMGEIYDFNCSCCLEEFILLIKC